MFSRGDNWRRQRRFTLHVLRDFGFGKNIMEEKVNFEIDRLIDYLETKTDRDIDVRPIIQTCVSSVIGNVAFGDSLVLFSNFQNLNFQLRLRL